MAADFELNERHNLSRELQPISRLIFDDYANGKYDAVIVAYTDFVSMLRQEPCVREPADYSAESIPQREGEVVTAPWILHTCLSRMRETVTAESRALSHGCPALPSGRRIARFGARRAYDGYAQRHGVGG